MWAKQVRSVYCDVCAAASPCLPTEAREDSTEWGLQLGDAYREAGGQPTFQGPEEAGS